MPSLKNKLLKILKDILKSLTNKTEVIVVDLANLLFTTCREFGRSVSGNPNDIGKVCSYISEFIEQKHKYIKTLIFSIKQTNNKNKFFINSKKIIDHFKNNFYKKIKKNKNSDLNIEINICYVNSRIKLKEGKKEGKKGNSSYESVITKLFTSPDDAIVNYYSHRDENTFMVTYDKYRDWELVFKKNSKLNNIITNISVECHSWSSMIYKTNSVRNRIFNIKQ